MIQAPFVVHALASEGMFAQHLKCRGHFLVMIAKSDTARLSGIKKKEKLIKKGRERKKFFLFLCSFFREFEKKKPDQEEKKQQEQRKSSEKIWNKN